MTTKVQEEKIVAQLLKSDHLHFIHSESKRIIEEKSNIERGSKAMAKWAKRSGCSSWSEEVELDSVSESSIQTLRAVVRIEVEFIEEYKT